MNSNWSRAVSSRFDSDQSKEGHISPKGDLSNHNLVEKQTKRV